MKLCEKCDKRQPDFALFCGDCGSATKDKGCFHCAKCGSIHVRKHCYNCGAPRVPKADGAKQ